LSEFAKPASEEAQARRAVEEAARRSYGKLVAFLAARTHDVAAAEDALSGESRRMAANRGKTKEH
jgi:predicted RNA polymerase sigma factor